MSGFSDETECPNCGASCDIYTDRKPFDYVSITCYNCGLMIGPKITYMTLEELNEARKDAYDLDPLETLPEQDKEIF